jgi:hypothetical protein
MRLLEVTCLKEYPATVHLFDSLNTGTLASTQWKNSESTEIAYIRANAAIESLAASAL